MCCCLCVEGDSPLTRARSGTGDAFVELDMREKAGKKSDGVRFTDDDLERTESNELRLTRSNSSEYTDFQSIGRKQGEVVVVSREIKSLRQEHHLRQRGIKQKIAGNTTQLNHTLSQANKVCDETICLNTFAQLYYSILQRKRVQSANPELISRKLTAFLVCRWHRNLTTSAPSSRSSTRRCQCRCNLWPDRLRHRVSVRRTSPSSSRFWRMSTYFFRRTNHTKN